MVDPALVIDAIQTLVRVPSVNPTIAPEEGTGEQAVATAARDWLRRHGVDAWLEEAAPGRPNCIAAIGSEGGKSLVWCAHLDTVGTSGMTIPPFEPTLKQGRLYGRGSYDMKGSAGAIMAAAATFAERPCPGRILLALVADEEDASAGAVHFVSHHTADACIVTEPSEGSLVLAHKGFVWLEVTTRGVAAHGSRWDLGVSAIGRMARVITALEQHDRDELRARVHPLVGPASMHCALINGGTGWSTYAPECRLKVERRTIPGEAPEQVLHELERIVHSAEAEADVRIVFERPPLVSDPGERIVQCVREAATGLSGVAPREVGVADWMDAAIFAAAGMPPVNYGPTGEGAHAAVEWVDIDSVELTARVLLESARRFLE
ncbi:MAG: M20/M25/M40 family metallo-hydrolase [Acidobacteriota bacterium]